MLFIALAGLVSYLTWPRGKEPEYKGKKLSAWLDLYQERALFRVQAPDAESAQAAEAVRQIGTNGIPWLVRWIDPCRGGSGLLDRLYWRLPPYTRRSKLGNWLEAESWRLSALAETGFGILGCQAEPAIPALLPLTERPTCAESVAAINSLYAIGTQGCRALQRALLNPKTDRISIVRLIALRQGYEMEGCSLVPEIGNFIDEADGAVALESVKALEIIGELPGVVYGRHSAEGSVYETNYAARFKAVPPLLKALHHRDVNVRMAATNALATIGAGNVPQRPAPVIDP